MNTELLKGYKQTELGVIPEDWDVQPCSDICLKIQDGTHFSPTLGGNDYLYVTSKNVRFGFLDISNTDRIDAAQHESIYKRCDVKRGDLLLTKDGANTGNAALNNLDEKFSLLSSVAFLRFDSKKHVAGYFLQQILSTHGQQQIQEAMSGNAITRLTLEKIKNLRFSVPVLPEQTAIATVLSDTDALIEHLEKLIAKKKAIKQGAMQQLLTGKKRLPGFKGKWEMKKLGEVAEIKTGKKNNDDKVEEGLYPFFVRSQQVERINSYSFDGEAILIPGEGNIGSIYHYINGKFDYHQRVYKISNFAEQYSGKFIYLSMSQNFNAHAIKNSVKATVDSLRLPTFQEYEISFPPTKSEQTAIATVLSDMDAEIESLEQKRNKYVMIKQGMMQELLTGRIRLIH